ncbi:general amidase [Fusarium subglutinans]|uniref:General amidase n=1 Tax=Gibberella subglutinans TaxID=42677 RepID=A0A8H5V2K7_GIBSU|nr:general amidase [Fusarium subglutinans]KAF5606485.1 general amidase [Fusarium subglutinans]
MAEVDTPSSPTVPAPPSVAEIQSIVNMDQGASQLAVKVLQALPEKPLMYRSKPRVGLDEDWLASIGDRLLTSTWETFGSYLSDRENTAKLREMGSRICINTRKTLREDQDDPSTWIESFSGANLRWEAVGVMFLYTALKSVLLSDKAAFQRQSQHLDQDGWNVDGRIYSSSLLRVRMMIALLRDQIREVAFAHDGEYDITDMRRLKAKQLNLYKQLPQHLVWDATAEEISEIDLEIDYPRLLIRLDHLLNMFLVERLLVKHGQARNELLRTSFEMVILTLSFWAQKHIWAALQGKCRWIIMGYATLAGAILCMELIDPVAPVVELGELDFAGGWDHFSSFSMLDNFDWLMEERGIEETSGLLYRPLIITHQQFSGSLSIPSYTLNISKNMSLPKTYKAASFDESGSELILKEVELQQPGPGFILAKVLACGVCHSDSWVQQGRFGDLFPRVPGHELVGDVVAVGDGVSKFTVGERVGGAWHGGHDGTCRSCQTGSFQLCDNGVINGVTMDGGYAEYVLLHAEAAVRIPSDADPAEVAPLLCAGVTVFNAIRRIGVLQGGLVAVQGLGGLGHLALQYASKMGYTVVAMSAGSEKKDFAIQLGAHHYIDSSKQDPCETLQKLGGANMILSTAPNAEAVSPLTAGLAALGKLVVLSPLGPVEFNTVDMIMKNISVHGWNTGHQQDSEDAIAFAHTHGIKCIIEKFDFDTQYREAFEKMESGKKREDRDGAIQSCEAQLTAVSDESVVPEHADISSLLEQLRTGKITAEKLVSVTIRRAIASHNETNCLSEPLFENALERAKYLDEYFQKHQQLIGPLHGIPVSVKDQFNIAGVDTTLGYVGRSFKPARDNAVMVTLLEKLGAVIITKTVIPQSIMYGETESPLWGLTTYPGRPELSPGGSSGGEATLMRMSGSLGGWATDIGGSIRVPSHLCGLFGLKPSSGRFSYSGAANSHEGQSHVPSSIGPMSPSLANLITLTKECLLAEPWKIDPNVVPIPWREADFEGVQERKLTIGVILDDGVVRPHPEIQEAVRRAVAILKKAGHKIIPWSTADHSSCIEIQDQFYRADGGEDIKTEVAVAGEPMIAHVEALVNSSKPISVYEYWQLNRRKTAAQEAYNKKWTTTAGLEDGESVDVIISPVSPHTAVPHRSSRWTGYAKIWNFLDYTAMSFPFAKLGSSKDPTSSDIYVAAADEARHNYLHEYAPRNAIDEWIRGLYDPEAMEGLDIGVQIIGRRYEEEKVLGVASLLEKLHRA